MDDIATFTSGRTEDRQDSWSLHLEPVRAFLLTMRKAGLTLKLEKCKFAQSSVIFVGHTIGLGLHGPDPHKVARHKTTKFEERGQTNSGIFLVFSDLH